MGRPFCRKKLAGQSTRCFHAPTWDACAATEPVAFAHCLPRLTPLGSAASDLSEIIFLPTRSSGQSTYSRVTDDAMVSCASNVPGSAAILPMNSARRSGTGTRRRRGPPVSDVRLRRRLQCYHHHHLVRTSRLLASRRGPGAPVGSVPKSGSLDDRGVTYLRTAAALVPIGIRWYNRNKCRVICTTQLQIGASPAQNLPCP